MRSADAVRTGQDTDWTRGTRRGHEIVATLGQLRRVSVNAAGALTCAFVATVLVGGPPRRSPRRIQVPVGETPWGFKSPLAH